MKMNSVGKTIARSLWTGLLSAAAVGLLASASHSAVFQDNFVKMYARSLTYNKGRAMYEAVGNISIIAGDYRISGLYAKYFPATKKLVVEDQFTVEVDQYRVFGSRLEYNAARREGNALIVRINFGETYLGGSFMKIEEERFEILNAYFTGCSLPDSHYHTASTELVFYPKTGLIVGYWGIFWIGSVPTVPVPTYVYGAPVPRKPDTGRSLNRPKRRSIDRTRDVWPTPGLGYNDEDGYFLVQPFDYYFGPKNYMRTHASWSEEKNLGVATAFNYIPWTDRLEGEVRVGTNSVDRTFGGVTQIFAFGPRLLSADEARKYVYDKYFIGNKYMFELAADYSDRERINIYKNAGPFNRVSFLPKISLRANRNFFLNDDFTYFGEGNWAKISEESTSANGNRVEAKGDVTFDHDLWFLGKFSAKCDFDLKEYTSENASFEGYWRTATQNLSLGQDWFGVLETSIGHRHIFMNEGMTPYEFEGYWFSPYDTLMTFAKLNILFSFLTFSGEYDLPSQDWRKLEYGLSLGMHCYNIVASYALNKDLEGNETTGFNITVELTPSRW